MRSVQVSRPRGPFEIVERDTPEPGARQVRIMVQACGVCHSDSFTKEGLFPGIQYVTPTITRRDSRIIRSIRRIIDLLTTLRAM